MSSHSSSASRTGTSLASPTETRTRTAEERSHEKAKRSGPNRRTVLTAGALAAGTATLGFQRLALAQTKESEWHIQFAAWTIKDGQEEKAIEMIKKLTQAVEKQEPGVLAYVAHRHADEPKNVVFYEVFDSEETVKTHGSQAHLREFIQGFSEAFEGPLKITKLDKVGGFTR